jgi:hypothetical protein
VATRLRRDFRTLTSCIEAHALLHRATRREDERGRIVATFEDYEAVRRYLGEAFSERVDSTVPKSIREAVDAVEAILKRRQAAYEQTHKPGDLGDFLPTDVGYSELAEELGIDPQAARRRALKALDKGWLQNMAKPHQKARLAPGDPLPKERHLLPTLEQLQATWEAMTTT